MEDEEYSQPFDKKDKKEKAKKPSPPPAKKKAEKKPKKRSGTPEPGRIDLAEPALADPEIKETLDKIHTMREELQEQFDKSLTSSGIELSEFEAYIDNPDNFSKLEWQRFQEKKDKFLKQFALFGEKQKVAFEKKKKKILTKKRKKKMLGARKKWLSM